jgi:hypothetical protein
MKRRRRAFLIASIALVTNAVIAQPARGPSFIYGTMPSHSVKQWIRFIVLGNRNSPFPIIWISPQHFRTSGLPEFLIVLPRTKYSIVESYMQSRIGRSDCLRKEPQRPHWFTVEILAHSSDGNKICIIPQAPACRFLRHLLQLNRVDWTAAEAMPIEYLMDSIKCRMK